MKAKQLENVLKYHTRFLSAGIKAEPETEECDIKVALVSSAPPKLKSKEQIIDALKRKLVCDRYCSSYALSDFFQSPTNGKKAEWKKRDTERQARVAAYRSSADKIVSDAELDEDSDAKEVLAELTALAKKHGLYV